MRKTPALLLSGLAAALALAAAPAMAQSKGDWTFGVGLHNVAPKSDNGSLDATALGLGKLPPTEVSNSVRPTFTGEYFLADNLGVEVLAALPFEHDIAIRGVGRVGSTKHLPPVVSLQYHFANKTAFTPFVGLGLNYTHLSPRSVSAVGSNIGSVVDLHVGSSWGLAAQAGVSYRINERWSAQASVATFRVKSRLTVRAGGLERSVTMRMNPVAAAAALSYSF